MLMTWGGPFKLLWGAVLAEKDRPVYVYGASADGPLVITWE